VQSLGPSLCGLGLTLGEACAALDGLDDTLAEVPGVGPHPAIAHTTTMTHAACEIARNGSAFTHATVRGRPGNPALL
jgi:hypothetical protein